MGSYLLFGRTRQKIDNMKNIRYFQKSFWIILIVDMLLLTGSLHIAQIIGFDFYVPSAFWDALHTALPVILVVKLSCFYFFDLYRGMWRYTSISDLINVIKAVSISSLFVIAFLLFSNRFERFSRSVFIIDWGVTLVLISGFRLCVRLFFEFSDNHNIIEKPLRSFFKALFKTSKTAKRLLIIGAGDCGEKIYREIKDNAGLQYDVVGFLDDMPVKIGKKIHAKPVLGSIADLVAVAKELYVDEVLIAIASASSDQMRKIVNYCRDSGLPYKTVPSLGELINGKVSLGIIRDVAYRDLLGREIINLDFKKIGAYLNGQCIFISGAGGSIGSEVCRQVCRFDPKRVILFERAESPLYEIELELKECYKSVEILPVLGDIQDEHQVDVVFEKYLPNIVFHAAAYKHVPMLEIQPWRAVQNNIKGTLNIVLKAKEYNISRFVFVSTDKAVRPTNVMGATKRVSEMIVQSQNRTGNDSTHFMIVRFGNVVGSVGSVIPLFRKQIEKGGPVTVTHPEVTRYFMTIPEACQLILQAGALKNGGGGEIFLFDMGEPINIAEMAKDLIRFYGLVPDKDVRIQYIGLRPGEKLYEELITQDEGVLPTSHEKIMVLKGSPIESERLFRIIETLCRLADEQSGGKIKETLKEIVPDYTPFDSGNIL